MSLPNSSSYPAGEILTFDDAGHRMAPTQAQKNGLHYRYYVSRPLLFGNAASAKVGSVSRVPAQEVEDQIRKVVLDPRRDGRSIDAMDQAFARSIIERIEIEPNRIIVWLKNENGTEDDEVPVVIPWIKPRQSERAQFYVRPRLCPRSPRVR